MESVEPELTRRYGFEEDDDHKIKEGTRRRNRQTAESEKEHSSGKLAIVAKFGDHVLRCLASSFLNVIRQAGRQAIRIPAKVTFRIQYLAFGNYLVVGMVLVVPRLFCERAFLRVRYL